MHVIDAITHRRSVRRFSSDPVAVTDIREILSHASLAPSIANRQMWRYIVITNGNLRTMLARLIERRLDEMAAWPEMDRHQQRIRAWRENSLHFVDAPVVIVVVNQGYRTPLDAIMVEHGMKASSVNELFSHPDIQSISGMIAYLTLLAEERGYATCWMTDLLIARHDLESSLDLKHGEEIIAFITLGKPIETPIPKFKKPIDNLIEWR